MISNSFRAPAKMVSSQELTTNPAHVSVRLFTDRMTGQTGILPPRRLGQGLSPPKRVGCGVESLSRFRSPLTEKPLHKAPALVCLWRGCRGRLRGHLRL